MQRVLGYTLTGDTREHAFFVFYGAGANGKSTLLNTGRTILGDYAKDTPSQTLLVQRYEGIPNDLARLHGARLVTAIETDAGKQLAESRIKQITGGDTVTARFLYGECFEYLPQFKLFMATNHRPRIQGTDEGIWRRVHLIPFEVAIPKHEQDPALGEKLRAEAPGILRWMVEGSMAWQQNGLAMPSKVRQATAGYRAEEDLLARFLDEECSLDTVAPGA
jgi:putative DNA primase/helicase